VSLPNPRGRSGNSLPAPTSTGGDFDPFLKAENIGNGKVGATASITVLSAPEPSESEFSDMTMPVRLKGASYAMGLKTSGGNYSRLYKRFGANPKKWKGAVKVEVKEFKKKRYVAVV
jgi:hypothetical protein